MTQRTRFIFLSLIPVFIYCFIWNALVYGEFVMEYSNTLHVKAAQYLAYFVWTMFTFMGWFPVFIFTLITLNGTLDQKK